MESIKAIRLASRLAALFAACLCFAAPGLALADAAGTSKNTVPGSMGITGAAAAQASAAQSGTDAPAADATDYALGGVQVSLPVEGFEIVTLSGVALASNEDASLVVTIVPVNADADLPVGDDELTAYFGDFAQATADELGVEVEAGNAYELLDGTASYVYLISYETEDGVSIVSGQCYVPTGARSFTMVQITFDANNDEVAELANHISATVALATPEAVQLDKTGDVELTQAVEAGGIAFNLPADFILDETSPSDEPTWFNEDGTVMLGVIPNLISEVSALGSDVLDLIAIGIAESLEGQIEGATVLDQNDAEVYVYVFTFASGEEEFVGALGMAILADDTVTGILALAPMESASEADAVVTAVFDSITLA